MSRASVKQRLISMYPANPPAKPRDPSTTNPPACSEPADSEPGGEPAPYPSQPSQPARADPPGGHRWSARPGSGINSPSCPPAAVYGGQKEVATRRDQVLTPRKKLVARRLPLGSLLTPILACSASRPFESVVGVLVVVEHRSRRCDVCTVNRPLQE